MSMRAASARPDARWPRVPGPLRSRSIPRSDAGARGSTRVARALVDAGIDHDPSAPARRPRSSTTARTRPAVVRSSHARTRGDVRPATSSSARGSRTTSDAAASRFRAKLISEHGVATTFGYGPRYLHSTGQFHKGGPSTGVFVEIVDDGRGEPVPGEPYDFGTLIRAQADGDLATLRAHGLTAVRVGKEIL